MEISNVVCYVFISLSLFVPTAQQILQARGTLADMKASWHQVHLSLPGFRALNDKVEWVWAFQNHQQ